MLDQAITLVNDKYIFPSIQGEIFLIQKFFCRHLIIFFQVPRKLLVRGLHSLYDILSKSSFQQQWPQIADNICITLQIQYISQYKISHLPNLIETTFIKLMKFLLDIFQKRSRYLRIMCENTMGLFCTTWSSRIAALS